MLEPAHVLQLRSGADVVVDTQQNANLCTYVRSPPLRHPVVQSRPHANPAALCVSAQQLPPALNLKCEEWILHFKQISVFA